MSLSARRVCTIALVATVLAAVCGPIGASAAPAYAPAPTVRPRATVNPSVEGRRLGMTLSHSSAWASEAQLARDLDAVAAAGATWVSTDLDWGTIERSPGVYHWDQDGRGGFDRTVRMARERGLDVLMVVGYSPPWARPAGCAGSDKCAPADPATFARFVRKAVERYAPQGVHTWQIWNEPNNSVFWKPRPSPAAYTALLRGAYREIKAVDRAAVVLAGGLSPGAAEPSGEHLSPVGFLAGMYGAGAGGHFDALAHHPYSFDWGAFPFNGHPLNGFVQSKFLHDVMVFVGDGAKKVWATEVGVPTGSAPGHSVSDTGQVRYLNEYLDGWDGWVNFRYPSQRTGAADFGSFTGPIIWYQVRDQGTDATDREQNFGLLRHDGTPKPAYRAFCLRAGGPACSGTGGTDAGATPAASPLVGAVGGRRSVQSAGIGRAAAANPVTGGYYVLDPDGAVRAYGGAPWFGSARFGGDVARDLAVMPDGRGYLVLDGWGGVHRFGSAADLPRGSTGYWRGWDIARSVAIAPDGGGYAVLDGFGGVHEAGTVGAVRGLPYWRGWDIARSLVLSPSGGAYVLDGWGAVHASRGAPALARPRAYWPGRDVARDLELTVTGRGSAILDYLGGVHTAGDAPALTGPPISAASRSWVGLALSGGSYVTVRAR